MQRAELAAFLLVENSCLITRNDSLGVALVTDLLLSEWYGCSATHLPLVMMYNIAEYCF